MATPEITPHEAHLRQSQGAVLVDVREDHERELGMAEGARGIARAELEEDPTFHFDDHDTELMLICQSGGRSMLAAEVLQRLGYRNVVSVRGGTLRWTADGFPLTRPGPRSEEHTSELQSLMRSTYAVFCLNKTKKSDTQN